jgi:thiol-disulfide isomerase/thioredoxin
MKVYDFIGTLLFKNKLFKHSWQKKRKLNRSPGIGCMKGFNFVESSGSPLSTVYSLPSVEKTRRKKFFAKKSLGSYVLYLATIKILFCVCLAHARQQGLGTPVATGVALSTDSIKPLQIGDTIPSALWNVPLQQVKAGQEGITIVRLNDYKGKLIILDFWATWCTACVAAMPKIDSLGSYHSKDMAVLPVTYEDAGKVVPFLNRNKTVAPLQLSAVVQDNSLKHYFPHRLVPHYVWISSSGQVRAFTGADEINKNTIEKAIAEEGFGVTMKKDMDTSRPLFSSGELPLNQLSFYSMLLKGSYPGLPSGVDYRYSNGKTVGLVVTNSSLQELYKIAIAKEITWQAGKRIIIEAASRGSFFYNPGSGIERAQWQKQNFYSFEIFAPHMDIKEMYLLMLKELNNSSGFVGTITEREIDCLTLCVIDRKKIPISTGGKGINSFKRSTGMLLQNMPVKALEGRLNNLLAALVIDETGLSDHLDIKLTNKLHDLQQINTQLKTYGLELKRAKRKMEILLVTDR